MEIFFFSSFSPLCTAVAVQVARYSGCLVKGEGSGEAGREGGHSIQILQPSPPSRPFLPTQRRRPMPCIHLAKKEGEHSPPTAATAMEPDFFLLSFSLFNSLVCVPSCGTFFPIWKSYLRGTLVF